MRALILAADGLTFSKNSTPACLQKLRGGYSLIEQQIRILNLCGIVNKNINIVVGSKGSWESEANNNYKALKNLPNKNIIVNDKNNSTTSEYSLMLFLEQNSNVDSDLLLINSDFLFDVKHIELLLASGTYGSLLTRKAVSVNERGVKLNVDFNGYISLVSDRALNNFPWNIYCGLCYLSKLAIVELRAKPFFTPSGGILQTIDHSISINSLENVNFDHSETNLVSETDSIDLRGGSFASLSRRHIVKKQASGAGHEKLNWEIEWLTSLPNELKEYFPTVLDSKISEHDSWFEMPWYDLPNLRKCILTGKFTADETCAFMKDVMSFMCNNIYSKTYEHIATIDWLKEKHILRVKDRIKETYVNCPELINLIQPRTLWINNKEYLNIPEALLEICKRKELLELLIPKQITMIHGDLHFQNILVSSDKKKPLFLLADPRGELNGSDIFYDMGKIWHSFNGLYDLIHTDLFTLETKIDEENRIETTKWDLQFPNRDLLKTYAAIKSMFPFIIEEFPLIAQDKNWLLKTLFNEAMHFCSVVAFHLHADGIESRAKALYLTGVILINEFILYAECDKYSSSNDIIDETGLHSWLIELGK